MKHWKIKYHNIVLYLAQQHNTDHVSLYLCNSIFLPTQCINKSCNLLPFWTMKTKRYFFILQHNIHIFFRVEVLISYGHEILPLEDSPSSKNPLVSCHIQKSVDNFGTGLDLKCEWQLTCFIKGGEDEKEEEIFLCMVFCYALLWQMDELQLVLHHQVFQFILYMFTTKVATWEFNVSKCRNLHTNR
jgi:hypothetical protein